jgi:undecaprenyl-diphosphatase
MRFDRPEIWTLAAVFTIAGLVLAFGHIAEEVFEGDATKFDQNILLFFRNASDVSDPIGPPWMEEMARDVTALGSMPFLASYPVRWSSISLWHISAWPRFGY